MKQILLSAMVLLSVVLHAQQKEQGAVGINTESPKATLEVEAFSKNGNTPEGVLIPRVTTERAEQMGENVEESTLLYITSDAAGTGTTTEIKGKGFYYYDKARKKWVRLVSEVIGGKEKEEKTIVYTDRNLWYLNYNLRHPNAYIPKFGTLPTDDKNFQDDPSLAKNTDVLYVSASGNTILWDPNYEDESFKDGLKGNYRQGPEIGGNSNFYKSGTIEDATGNKQGSIYRAGKIGIGVKNPISNLHTNGIISGLSYYYYSITVDNTRGDESTDDTIFNTLVEAIEYANTIVNNSPIRIFIYNTTETIDKPINIGRDIIIQGRKLANTINLNAKLTLADGVLFAFAEGYDMTINQNTETAFLSRGGNKIMLGGYSGVTWNFTAPNQNFVDISYYSINTPVQLSFSRAVINTNGNSNIAWGKLGEASLGRYDISYWQTTLPKDISYAKARNIIESNESWQNIVGSETVFSGLDTSNNNALVEYMRLNKQGNLGIGTNAPSEKLEVNGKIKSSDLKGTNTRIVVANKEGVLSTQKVPTDLILSGLSSSYYSITVDNTRGNESTDDTIFNTLVEAIEYANTIVNNSPVRIFIGNTTEAIDKPIWINRDIFILGKAKIANTINLNATLNLADGVTFGFIEGNDMTINQNIETAFLSKAGNKIMLGGYSGVTWNFTAPNQNFVDINYTGINAPVQLSFSRVVINTNGNSNIAWGKLGGESLGRYDISYWQTTLPKDISYAKVHNIVQGNESWQNIVGSETIFSGLDTNNNNALIEYMRLNEQGNLGIGTTTPSEKLEVAGAIKIGTAKQSECTDANRGTIKFENDNFYGCKSTGWVMLNN